MIKHITLKNFRRHESLDVDFTTGLNVLRGANEQGKSTVIEAVLYALFGSKALRTTLAEAVTWGQKESSLHVKLVLSMEGKDYTFTRSKGGAECNYAGGKVTGQAEVSSYASDLLGADAKTASMLMLSSQSGLRGALDDGPAAVSALMGKLADFDLIDRLVESAQTNLLLGSDTPIKEKVDAVEAEIAALVIPTEDTWKTIEAKATYEVARLQAMESKLTTVHQPEWEKALRELNEAVAHNTRRTSAEGALSVIVDRVKDLGVKMASASARAQRVDPAEIERARVAVEGFRNLQATKTAYAAIQALNPYPETFWEGPKGEFEAELAATQTLLQKTQQAMQTALAEAKALRRTKITSGKCPTCGHEAHNDDHVKAHNDKVEAEAVTQDKAHQTASRECRSLSEGIALLEGIKRTGDRYEREALKYPGFPILVDDSVYPPRVTWTGDVPGGVDLSGAPAQLKLLQDRDNEAIRAEGELKAHLAARKALEEQIAEAEASLAKMTAINLQPLQERHDVLYGVYAELFGQIEVTKAQVQELRNQANLAKREFDDGIARLAALQSRLSEYKSDLVKLNFNNGLLKKLKALKPSITDQLWNTVLSAVSNFFSSLRGESSVVTKDATGFKVNGQNVESLSGSTLDVLALSIRVALTKTFIPHASFIVLDEPAHGADATRTGNILGFLSSVGFQQTLLASHDELSESVADNVIAL